MKVHDALLAATTVSWLAISTFGCTLETPPAEAPSPDAVPQWESGSQPSMTPESAASEGQAGPTADLAAPEETLAGTGEAPAFPESVEAVAGSQLPAVEEAFETNRELFNGTWIGGVPSQLALLVEIDGTMISATQISGRERGGSTLFEFLRREGTHYTFRAAGAGQVVLVHALFVSPDQALLWMVGDESIRSLRRVTAMPTQLLGEWRAERGGAAGERFSLTVDEERIALPGEEVAAYPLVQDGPTVDVAVLSEERGGYLVRFHPLSDDVFLSWEEGDDAYLVMYRPGQRPDWLEEEVAQLRERLGLDPDTFDEPEADQRPAAEVTESATSAEATPPSIPTPPSVVPPHATSAPEEVDRTAVPTGFEAPPDGGAPASAEPGPSVSDAVRGETEAADTSEITASGTYRVLVPDPAVTAEENLRRIAESASIYYSAYRVFPTSTEWTPDFMVCDSPTIDPDAWDGTWAALGFALEGETAFQYRFVSSDSPQSLPQFEVQARTDSDCDGVFHKLTLEGRVGATGVMLGTVASDNAGE